MCWRPRPRSPTCSRRAPALVVLATSRAPLRVRGEQRVPRAAPGPARPRARAQRRTRWPSRAGGALFVERARAASPAFALTRDERGGGGGDLPAAGRPAAGAGAGGGARQAPAARGAAGAAGSGAAAARRRGARPAGAPADHARRHRLELRPARRRRAAVFRRLAVFAVAAPSRRPRRSAPPRRRAIDVLATLASLLDKSLLRRVGEPGGGAGRACSCWRRSASTRWSGWTRAGSSAARGPRTPRVFRDAGRGGRAAADRARRRSPGWPGWSASATTCARRLRWTLARGRRRDGGAAGRGSRVVLAPARRDRRGAALGGTSVGAGRPRTRDSQR